MPRRDYNNDYPSVTDVIGILRKIGLENYFRHNTPEFIAEDSKKAKEIGTQIHEVIQKHIELEKISLETEYPNEVQNSINSFFKFKSENSNIKLKRSEIKMTSELLKLNGTLDCIAEENGLIELIDWKTGKCNVGKVDKKGKSKEVEKPPIYEDYIYQAVLYSKMYEEIFKTNISYAKIIVFAKDKVSYNLITIASDLINVIFNDGCLPLLQVYKNNKVLTEILKFNIKQEEKSKL